MPLYTFKCNDCGRETKKITSSTVGSIDCECGNFSFRQIPTSTNTMTYEMKDKHRGTSLQKDLDKKLKKRLVDHHDRYELEEKIDQHGTDDAQKFGWFKKVKKL